MSNEVKVGDQIGVSKLTAAGGDVKTTYVRVPMDFVTMYDIKPGQIARFYRSADGDATIIQIADEVGDDKD